MYAKNKRQRLQASVQSDPATGSLARLELADPASLRQTFSRGAPFPYIFIDNIFPPEVLRRVRDELLAEKYKPKCNDLYHFEQVRRCSFHVYGSTALLLI